MKIAILSDIHDNLPALRQALKQIADRGAEVLICCGDLCSPFVAKELGLGFGGPVHVVFGNNDGDRWRIGLNAVNHPHLQLHGEFVELELGGRTFAVQHFDNIGRALAKGAAFDVVCFGHNHRFEISQVGDTLLINPGEIYGGLTGASTFVIYDPALHRAERVEVEMKAEAREG
ncbi:MAG: metallophosphoesterase [Verrucomicrobiales bacterium]|nr:metallophosphoesterase [Verrucomicrobiales bacterium]